MTRTSSWRRGVAISAIVASLWGCGQAGPLKPLFTTGGLLIDSAGHPIAGAVISDGTVGTLTGDDGRYELAVFHTALTAIKPGYASARFDAVAGEEDPIRLQPRAVQTRVGIDGRGEGAQLTGLTHYLAGVGFETQPYPQTSLARLDALVIAAPPAMSAQEIAAIQDWIRGGGRLILLGEWGGFPGQSLDTLNALASGSGIQFSGGTVKQAGADADASDWFSVSGLAPASFAGLVGAGPIDLYATTSLSLTEGAHAIFDSGPLSYAVLSGLGRQVLGAVGADASGKVFAVGDSSLWLDADSGGTGQPNWQRGANKSLAVAMLSW
ncbi:MAG TPA: DUF4350 domain-containing protein [Oscillatoriaceae cyanobacterium]